MKQSIKTVKLPLVKPKPEVEQRLDILFRGFRYVYDESAKRMPSIPRKRVKFAKSPTYYEWVKEFNIVADLHTQVAQEAVMKARESYASMISNNVYAQTSKSVNDVARFHNRCFKIERFGGLYFLSLPVCSGRRDNRVVLPFKPNEYSEAVLKQVVSKKLKHGTGELKKYGDEYWFNLTIKKPVEEGTYGTPVGVDMGISNTAVACAYDGATHVKLWSGKRARYKRKNYLQTIKTLQSKGKLRTVKKLKRKYREYMLRENHRVSSEIIKFASEYPNPYIIVENLHRFRKQNDWTFAELRKMIEYKALQSGMPMVQIDAKNTSITCNKCGYRDKENRNGIIFKCLRCGYEVNADVNAAINITTYATDNR